jgi:Tol biopolymer transport system component
MFCRKCGAEAIEGSRFCSRCGGSLEERAGEAIEKGTQRGAAQRPTGRHGKPLRRLPAGRKAAIVSGLVIALIGATLGGYVGLGGRLPDLGSGGSPGETVIVLPDGASIRIPPQAVEGKPKVVARVVAAEDAPSLPDWADGAPALYEFTVDRPLRGAAELRIPLPGDAELALLSHYHDGSWKPVPFRIEAGMAVAEVTELSLFGFLVVGYDKLERWLQAHTLINWALGGGTQAAGSPCEREAPGVTVRVDGTPRAVSACAQNGNAGTEVIVRNDRRFYLDVYPVRGDLQWVSGGLSGSCCGGQILPPEGKAGWLWRAPDSEAVLEARFTLGAWEWTFARLLLAPFGVWAWGDSAGLDMLQPGDVSSMDTVIQIVLELSGENPDYPVVAREGLAELLSKLLSNPDRLARALERLIQKGILTQKGIYATSRALSKLLALPTVASEIRTAADLVAGALAGGVAALVTALPSGRIASVPSPTPTPTSNRRVAFWSERDGHTALYTVDADGSNLTRVSDGRPPQPTFGTPRALDYSTDLFYGLQCPREPGDWAVLYVVNARGGGRVELGPSFTVCGSDFGGAGTYDGVTASPDGGRVVFTSSRKPPGLYLGNRDSSGRRYLARGALPAWSPQGDTIAFSRVVRDANSLTPVCGVYTIQATGTSERLVAKVLCQGGDIGGNVALPRPVWSPDGSMLSFAAVAAPDEPELGRDVFTVKADGSGVTRITRDPADDFDPVWIDCRLPTAGCEATVTNVRPKKLEVRKLPGVSEPVIGRMAEGDTVCLLGSPALAGRSKWWPVYSAGGLTGWAAASDPEEPDKPWITPTGRECSPVPGPTLRTISPTGLSSVLPRRW